MITGLEIYSLNKEPIKMYEITKNTIVLLNNSTLKRKFVKEFLKIRLDETDENTENDKDICYSTVSEVKKAKEQDHKAEIKTIIEYKPTSIFVVDDEQKFIFTTEAPFVLQCKDRYDLWFCDSNDDDEVELYAFTEYKNHEENWNEGVDKIYKMVINGRFGCYEGYGY